MIHAKNAKFLKQFGYTSDDLLVSAQMIGFSEEEIMNFFTQYPYVGKIDLDAIRSGEEVIVTASVCQLITDLESGCVSCNFLSLDQYDSSDPGMYKDQYLSVGQEITLTDLHRISSGIAGFTDPDEATNIFQRVEKTVRVGCIFYVFVDELGNLKISDMVSHTFHKYMKAFIYGNEERFARFRIADGELQIPRVRDLRHTCASLLVKDGVSLSIIKDWLGHSSITITSDTYSHIYEESKKETAVSIGKTFGDDEEIIASHDEGTDKKAGEENTSLGLRQNKPVRKKGEMER